MPSKPHYWDEATAHLQRSDKTLKGIIAKYPEVKLRLKKDSFTTLARAIVGQQISVKAADSIWAKFVTAAEGSMTKLNPAKIIALETKALRACGLSQRKVIYLQNLAERYESGHLNGQKLAHMQDAEVKKTLVALHGIGPWTADMYMMFNLWRPDILPLGDVGLIRAIELHYFKGKKVPLEKIRKAAEPWSPYATVATWYLWRSLDPIPVEY